MPVKRVKLKLKPELGSLLPSGKRSVAGTQAVLNHHTGQTYTYNIQPTADTFLYVLVELFEIFMRREEGKPRPFSEDPILEHGDFANVFRVLDESTQYILRVVIPEGPAEFEERVFRVLLFGLFDRIETYELLRDKFGIPSRKNFDRKAWARVLEERLESGGHIFTGNYQNNPPKEGYLGGSSIPERTLRLFELMISTNIAEDISDCDDLGGMQATIARYTTMGKWLGYQRIADVNMIPTLVRSETWALPGPGATRGLQLIFGQRLKKKHFSLALLWLWKNANTLFRNAGYAADDIPELTYGKPGLSVVDFEHVLCEFARYVDAQLQMKGGNDRPTSFGQRKGEDVRATRVLPELWTPATEAFPGYTPTLLADSFAAEPPPPSFADLFSIDSPLSEVSDDDESLPSNPSTTATSLASSTKDAEYEVSAIVKKKKFGDGMRYLVRWAGYGPEDDSWQPEEELLEDVPDMVKKFNQRHGQIANMVQDFAEGRL